MRTDNDDSDHTVTAWNVWMIFYYIFIGGLAMWVLGMTAAWMGGE